MRTKEQMYEDIRNWEMEAGEDFLDYFDGSLNEFNFMFWCLGKGYINEDQLKAFESTKHHGSEFLYGDEFYSVVNEEDEEDFDKRVEKAYRMLADFLSSTETYQRRVDEFLKGITRIKFEDILREYYRRDSKLFFELDGERTYLKEDTPLNIEILTKAIWYRED